MASKVAEIGHVPDHWDVAPLINFVEWITYGFTNPMPDTEIGPWKITAKDVVDGNINYSTARHTSQDAFDNELTKKSKPRIGDVLLTKDGSIGRVAVVDRDGICINQSVAFLRPNYQKIYPFFLKYLLLTPYYQEVMERDSDGSTIKHIYITRVDKMQVAVPPIDEQAAILNIIKTLDDKIELNRRMNETLEAIARTMFKSWFVDFDPVRAKMNGEPPESICQRLGLTPDLLALFPDRLVNSELGEIPEGWEVWKIEKLLSRLSTKIRYTKDDVMPYGTVPVFEQGAGILLGYHNGTAQFEASASDPAFIFGDHTCVTHLACEPFDISQNVIPLKGANRPTLWVYYSVQDKQVFQEYRRHWMELVAKDVVVPPVLICNQFAKIVCPLHLGMEAYVRQSRELSVIRDALLPKLLSGELRVPVDGAI